MNVPRSRLVALGLVVVMLAGAVAATPAALGAASAVDAGTTLDAASAAQTLDAENASLTVEPADAGAESTHTWSFDDVDYGGEVDTITVDYPLGTSFDGLTNDDVTVAITRDGEMEPTEISVNSDQYAGSAATFDLSGVYNTDVDGPVVVTIEGVENPQAGNHTATLTFEGDDTVTVEANFTVAGSGGGEPPGEPAEADISLDPATAGAASVHTWSFDDVDYGGEVDVITVDYPAGTSFDGLTNDDVTVAITREGESEPTDISVNSGDYGGSQATFDLSGVYNTDVDGPVIVTIEGVENPPAGEATALLTFEGDDTVTAEAAFEVTEPTETLVVEVIDADGDPVADSTVVAELDGPTGAVDPTEAVVLAETDGEGTATVEVDESGEYAVTVTARGEGAATETVEIDGTTAASFALEPAESGTVAALVTDADGEPLPEGTWVSLRGDDLDAPLTGQVDTEGVVTLAGVTLGEHALRAATLDRGETTPRTVVVAADETVTTEFTYGDAPTTATLAGSVATSDGDALVDETVVVEYDPVGTDGGTVEPGVAVVEIDADGEFAVPFVPVGEYEVMVTAGGFAASDPATVDLAAGERADVTLTERATGSISGVVTDADGDALSEGTWVSFHADGFETAKTVRLGPGGTFAIDGIAPGSYDVVAETLNHGTTDAHKVNVATGETSGVELSYAADDSPGNGPPAGVPGEGNPGGGNGPDNGPGNGNGPPAIATVPV